MPETSLSRVRCILGSRARDGHSKLGSCVAGSVSHQITPLLRGSPNCLAITLVFPRRATPARQLNINGGWSIARRHVDWSMQPSIYGGAVLFMARLIFHATIYATASVTVRERVLRFVSAFTVTRVILASTPGRTLCCSTNRPRRVIESRSEITRSLFSLFLALQWETVDMWFIWVEWLTVIYGWGVDDSL